MRVIRMHACMPRTCTPRTHAEGAWRNGRTYLRVRPGGDEDGECPVLIECDGSGAEPSKVSAAHNGKSEAFAFDRAFACHSAQEDVFGEVQHFVQSALDGYHVSLLAYGQTGAGKTWTMMGGSGENEGIIPRAIKQMLTTVEEMKATGWAYTLEGSFLEIYNENVRDLLVSAAEADGKQYSIQAGSHGCMTVTDLTSRCVPACVHAHRNHTDLTSRCMRTFERAHTATYDTMSCATSCCGDCALPVTNVTSWVVAGMYV